MQRPGAEERGRRKRKKRGRRRRREERGAIRERNLEEKGRVTIQMANKYNKIYNKIYNI